MELVRALSSSFHQVAGQGMAGQVSRAWLATHKYRCGKVPAWSYCFSHCCRHYSVDQAEDHCLAK